MLMMNNFYNTPMNVPMNNNIPSNFNFNNSNNDNLIRVTGLEGARAFQMRPNSTIALFDNAEDIMYIKSTDGAGFPTIRTFIFEEVTSNNPVPTQDYVTRKEFEELKEMINNGKQFIQQPNKSKSTNNK